MSQASRVLGLKAGCADVRRCAELQPLDAAAWNALGRVEELRGCFAHAVAAFERADALTAAAPPGGRMNCSSGVWRLLGKIQHLVDPY